MSAEMSQSRMEIRMHGASVRLAEAARLITLARGMLAAEGSSLAITHLDLAFDDILERQQTAAELVSSEATVPAVDHG
jgi:stage V sporulation protein SpoVS